MTDQKILGKYWSVCTTLYRPPLKVGSDKKDWSEWKDWIILERPSKQTSLVTNRSRFVELDRQQEEGGLHTSKIRSRVTEIRVLGTLVPIQTPNYDGVVHESELRKSARKRVQCALSYSEREQLERSFKTKWERRRKGRGSSPFVALGKVPNRVQWGNEENFSVFLVNAACW